MLHAAPGDGMVVDDGDADGGIRHRHAASPPVRRARRGFRRPARSSRQRAATLGNIGNVLNEFGRPEEALAYFIEAAAIQGEVGDKLGEALTLGNLGLAYQHQGRCPEAVTVSERALALFRELDDRPGAARVLSNLAEAHTQLRSAEAMDYGLRAMEAGRACGARDIEALALRDLGQACHDLGDVDRAREYWRQALAIFDELGEAAAAQVRAMLGSSGPAAGASG